MTPKQEAAIIRHGENLINLFNLDPTTDPVKLCKQLRRLEVKAHRIAEQWCNGEIDQEQWDDFEVDTLEKLTVILGDGPVVRACFVNGDPRGYALKIDDQFCRDKRIHKDWGGYGILAPEINAKGE